MKRILAMALAFVVVLALCACGAASTDGAADTTAAVDTTDAPADTTAAAETTAAIGDSSDGKLGYVGTWKVIPPSDDPFPPLFLVLNEDGTAGWGAKLDNLAPRIWYECDEADAKEGQMELSREDNKGYGDDFYLTEDGKLYMEVNLSVGENSYDHVYFEKQ